MVNLFCVGNHACSWLFPGFGALNFSFDCSQMLVKSVAWVQLHLIDLVKNILVWMQKHVKNQTVKQKFTPSYWPCQMSTVLPTNQTTYSETVNGTDAYVPTTKRLIKTCKKSSIRMYMFNDLKLYWLECQYHRPLILRLNANILVSMLIDNMHDDLSVITSCHNHVCSD
jgi:hypothetical protein